MFAVMVHRSCVFVANDLLCSENCETRVNADHIWVNVHVFSAAQ